MAKINTDSLAADITQRIASLNSSSSGEEYLYSAVAARSLDRSNTVATVDDLPDLAIGPLPNGIIVFVESLGVLVISANTQWVGLDGRLLRNDLTSGAVWAWGVAQNGQLGDGTQISRSSPVSVIGGIANWSAIAAGNDHSVAIRTDGTAWSWGRNLVGQLGHNTDCACSRSSPVSVVGGISNWCVIAAGAYHSVAIRTNGTAWSWGSNSAGRLGDGTVTTRSSPVAVIGGITDWSVISAGGTHSVAIRADGTAWSWGLNGQGRLGDGTITLRSSPVAVTGGFTDWCAIAAGSSHSLAIRANGTAWAWGDNGFAQLGDDTFTLRSSPVSVVGGIADWCRISAGFDHSVAIRANGTMWSWGRNCTGQLGDGTVTNRSSPVSVIGGFTDWCQISAGRYQHSAAIRTNGTAWSWGGNGCGRLGDGTVTTRSSPVSVVGGFANWSVIAAGNAFSLAIRNSA